MGKELRGPFWKKPVRVESTIRWTLWAIAKLPFNKSKDVHIFFLRYTQTPTQTHRTCKSTTTITQIPPSTQHRPTITTQPPPPKLIKTMETQNIMKIKLDLPKIHKKPITQTQKINLKLNHLLKTHNPNPKSKSKYKLNGGRTLENR